VSLAAAVAIMIEKVLASKKRLILELPFYERVGPQDGHGSMALRI
jgi:hypothetical protein